MHLSYRLLASLLLSTAFLAVTSPVQAGSPNDVTQLTAALDKLDQWIGDDENGDRWRAYLQSKQLREQLAKGEQADPADVSRVLQQYRSNATGLDLARFVTVRRQLQSWLDDLRNQYAGDLAKLAWAARGDHKPVTDESFAAVRRDLRSAANRLENRLGLGSSFAEAWKTYLRWPLLEPHFAEDFKVSGKSLRDLEVVLRRLRANKPGLENSVFVRTADAIERYRELAFWYALGQRRDTRGIYSARLLELEKQITRNLEKPTVESTRQIGKLVGLIDQLGHSPWLVEQVNEKFKRPNVWANISSAAVNRMLKRPVTDTDSVVDCILGVSIRGNASILGMLTLKTLPADDHVAVRLQLNGNIQSKTYGYKGPVRVGNDGSTDFVATKNLQISDEQFLMLPSTVSARMKSKIRSIEKLGGPFGQRLIKKIARKRVYKQKAQAEWIASCHAEQRVAKKFDKRVSTLLYTAREKYDTQVRPPLQRIDMFPEYLHMGSTHEGVQIETTLASYKQISTDRLPPGRQASNDVTLQVHESAVNNFLPAILAGTKFSQLSESAPPKIEGDVPAWLKKAAQNPQVEMQFIADKKTPTKVDAEGNLIEEDAPAFKPWSMQLNSEHPISVSLDDQKVTLRIRIAELKIIEDGEESVQRNWDFLVTYRVTQNGNGIVLRREGTIQALPTGFDPVWFGDERWGDRLTAKQAGIRKNLEANINKRVADGVGFPEDVPIPPIEIPRPDGTKLSLEIEQLDCDNGWLTLGYRLPL